MKNPSLRKLKSATDYLRRIRERMRINIERDAMLSQGEQRDADISFDTTASFMRFHWHSTGFLHRPTSATVQMLKLHTVG